MEYNLIKNMILSFIIGDTLGQPFENLSFNETITFRDIKQENYGFWTDDTSMVLATMSSISDKGKIDLEDIKENFLSWLNYSCFTPTNYTYGYGRGTYNALKIKNYDKNKSLGNGSLMRILPISIYAIYKNLSLNDTIKLIIDVASITHTNKDTLFSCVLYTEILRELIKTQKTINYAIIFALEKDYSKYFDKDYVKDFGEFILDNSINYKDNYKAKYTLKHIIKILCSFNNYEDIITKTIQCGCDTDTSCALISPLYCAITQYNVKENEVYKKLIKKDYIEKIIDKFIKTLKESDK